MVQTGGDLGYFPASVEYHQTLLFNETILLNNFTSICGIVIFYIIVMLFNNKLFQGRGCGSVECLPSLYRVLHSMNWVCVVHACNPNPGR